MLRVGGCGADSRHPQADSNFFQRREFCFTLDGDIFVRYQSFKVGFACACLISEEAGFPQKVKGSHYVLMMFLI